MMASGICNPVDSFYLLFEPNCLSHAFPSPNRLQMRLLWRAVLLLVGGWLLLRCQPAGPAAALPDTALTSGQLAQRYCASCHLFPEPALLDKATWTRSVLPAMAWRLGIRDTAYQPLLGRNMSEQYLIRQATVFPDSAQLSLASWQRIVDYYDSLAPAQLLSPAIEGDTALPKAPFALRPVALRANTDGRFTLLRQHPDTKKIYLADGLRTLYQLNDSARVEHSFALPDAVTDIHFNRDGTMYLLTIGDLNPHDEPLGGLFSLNGQGTLKLLIRELSRPVHMNVHDLDQDGQEDVVICEFGNYVGRLSWFRQTADGFEKRVLWENPGAVKTMVRDLDQDGRPDLLALIAQGREGVYAFYNQGDGRFRMQPLLQFPPVYGSSDFTLADVDRDGDEDLLLAQGDNADLSNILKPYHGVRIYRNEGDYRFREAYFYPMYGATRIVSEDFDADGDMDVAISAYFPDFGADNPRSFVYLENTTTSSLAFVSHTLDGLDAGRWLIIEPIYQPGQPAPGIMLGALNLELARKVEEEMAQRKEWNANLMMLNLDL